MNNIDYRIKRMYSLMRMLYVILGLSIAVSLSAYAVLAQKIQILEQTSSVIFYNENSI